MIERLIEEADGDDAALISLLNDVDWKAIVRADLGRTLGDDPNPWPQPGTGQELDWAYYGGRISKAVYDAAFARIHA